MAPLVDFIRRWPRPERPHILGELVIVLLLVRVYDYVRGFAALRTASADSHGAQVLETEHALHLDLEHASNAWLSTHSNLQWLAGGYYQTVHLTVTLGVLAWCWWRAPELYRRARTALVLVNLVGLATFAFFPVAPPRLLPGRGFVDSILVSGLGSEPAGPGAADTYAAMPSLHIAWALCTAFVGIGLASHTWTRRAWYAYPCLTGVVVVTTANHYVLDVVAGALVGLLALGGARSAERLTRPLPAVQAGFRARAEACPTGAARRNP